MKYKVQIYLTQSSGKSMTTGGYVYKVVKLVNTLEPPIDSILSAKDVENLMTSPYNTVYITAKGKK